MFSKQVYFMLNTISANRIGEEHCYSWRLSHQQQTLSPSFLLMNFRTTESLLQGSLSIPTSSEQFCSNERPFTLTTILAMVQFSLHYLLNFSPLLLKSERFSFTGKEKTVLQSSSQFSTTKLTLLTKKKTTTNETTEFIVLLTVQF